MKKILWFIVCLMTMVVSANAQNSVVDEFATNEPTETYYDKLTLSPYTSIKENYAKIDSLISLHKENGYARYYIDIYGIYLINPVKIDSLISFYKERKHYISPFDTIPFYKWHFERITIKGKRYETIMPFKQKIIRALTELYTHSLDKKFNIPSYEQQHHLLPLPFITVRFYWVDSSSPLYEKVYHKVSEEIEKIEEIKNNKEIEKIKHDKNSPLIPLVADYEPTFYKVYDVVEQMPSFPNVEKWIKYNMIYPIIAAENGIQGRVVTTFVIERDGSITDVKVTKSVDPSLDNEAVRLIKSMPKWTPGKQNGQNVSVKYTLPVIFKL